MKINKLKINNYGKLKEKEIEFDKNINIIYGENESGKSTLLNFIINSIYGISKNKRGKDISNFEKYAPWVGEEFSGKLEYELDNKEKFEVFRDFKKKNPKLYNEEKEEISKQFNIDKNRGNEFFYEQTKVDEELFLSTIVVNQQEVKLGKQEQNILIQKLANLVGTGDDKVSFKIAIDRINRRQLEEIGTERSREKPVNLISKEINELEIKIQELEKYKAFKYEFEEKVNNLKEEINKLENQNYYLKELKLLNENQKIEEEKIKIKQGAKENNLKEINNLESKVKEIEINSKATIIDYENKKCNKHSKDSISKASLLFFIVLILLNIIQFIYLKIKIVNYIFLLTIPFFMIVYIFIKNRCNKRIKEEREIEKRNKKEHEKLLGDIDNLNNQIKILKKNNVELEEDINKLTSNIKLKSDLEIEKINKKYLDNIVKNGINDVENLNYEIQSIENRISGKKIELHTLDLDKRNLEEKLEDLAKLEEKLVNGKERFLSLQSLNNSFNLAKEVLMESYEEMKSSVTPKFTQNLSENISKFTKGKYNNIIFKDEEGLIVELDNGSYVSAIQLSIGTIEQLYLSLRLSMVKELSNEKMPIILDEVFAYYDDDRLENALNYICNRFSDNQLIIFSCTKREKDILEKLNIKFNYVSL